MKLRLIKKYAVDLAQEFFTKSILRRMVSHRDHPSAWKLRSEWLAPLWRPYEALMF